MIEIFVFEGYGGDRCECNNNICFVYNCSLCGGKLNSR